MKRLYSVPEDFEAMIRIYSESKGGRNSPAYNVIRWDFSCADPPSELACDNSFMIYPDFYDNNCNSLFESPLPTDIELPARMIVSVDELREEVHGKHLRGRAFLLPRGVQARGGRPSGARYWPSCKATRKSIDALSD